MKKVICLFVLVLFSSVSMAKTISIVTLDWQPFCGDKAGKNVHLEIVMAAVKAMGHTPKLTILPWKRAVAMSKAGNFDMLACMWFSEERAKDFTFSNPSGVANELVFFKSKSANITFDGDFTKLKKYKIGVISGFTYPDKMMKAGLQFDYANDDATNLKKLENKRIDLILSDKIQTISAIVKLVPGKLNTINYIDKSAKTNELFVGIPKKSKGHKENIKIMNDGFAKLKASGELDKIKAKYGLK